MPSPVKQFSADEPNPDVRRAAINPLKSSSAAFGPWLAEIRSWPDPFERPTVRVGPGYRSAVHAEQKTARRSSAPGAACRFGENTRRLVGYPVLAELHDPVRKGLPIGLVGNVGQHGRVKDDERGTRWGLPAELHESISEQIASHHAGL